MSSVGSSYSQIIHPKDYNQIMSHEHLYIPASDRFIAKKIRELIASSSEVIELGCGPARILSLVSKIEGINLTGIDLDSQFIDYARTFIKRTNVQIINADATKYVHHKEVDIFYSQGFHHHFPKGINTSNYLRNVYDNLKYGGYYILSDEFIPNYADEKEREIKIVIWYSHIIAHAIKHNFNYLAQEEAKTLLDDLFEGRINKNIKSQEQIEFVLSNVKSIDQSARIGKLDMASKLAEEFLSAIEVLHNFTFHGDAAMDLSRGDYKICDQAFRKEIQSTDFRIEDVKTFGPLKTIGAMSVYILRKR
ncbi:MAG: Methyltransferase domain [Alphaproteobacteria bacterium]|jgi:cyclopropane fatty-acyl-phospholipid synthase-like methyltransferase|nr:Methyltransferase domain [Alphaproteobacteria bacterium]